MGYCVRGVAELFYHFFAWRDDDDCVPLIRGVPDISCLVQSDAIRPFKERMGDKDGVQTERV
jgi:hypothetical protein